MVNWISHQCAPYLGSMISIYNAKTFNDVIELGNVLAISYCDLARERPLEYIEIYDMFYQLKRRLCDLDRDKR
jgi:hypothetical protein